MGLEINSNSIFSSNHEQGSHDNNTLDIQSKSIPSVGIMKQNYADEHKQTSNFSIRRYHNDSKYLSSTYDEETECQTSTDMTVVMSLSSWGHFVSLSVSECEEEKVCKIERDECDLLRNENERYATTIHEKDCVFQSPCVRQSSKKGSFWPEAMIDLLLLKFENSVDESESLDYLSSRTCNYLSSRTCNMHWGWK